MGKHYVPQKYLNGFSVPGQPGYVWQFDKQQQRFANAPVAIKGVAQQRHYYDEVTEKILTERVENPGNMVLDKLRTGQAFSETDKVPLAIYMATMMNRVPRNRDRGKKLMPKALETVIESLKAELRQAAEIYLASQDHLEKLLAEAERAGDHVRSSPPAEVLKLVESPWPSDQMVAAIYNMNWYFVHAEGPSYFLTSDNPFFFFGCYGLATKKSELTFPISSELCLFGTWNPVKNSRKAMRAPHLVKEANRRLASEATRFVYYHSNADWISTVAMKQKPYLSRIIG